MTTSTAPEILPRLDAVRKTAAGWQARCPAHDDQTASLAIALGDDGRLLLHCHANCATADVLRAVNMTMADLMPKQNGGSHNEPHQTNGAARSKGKSVGRIVAEYDYHNESGKLLYQAVRFEPKDFRQRAPNGDGWSWKLNGVNRVLFRLPKLLAADPSKTVFICEGEKDVLALAALGLVATCNVGGAGKWRAEYSEVLRGRNVVVLPDNDDAGRDHAATVANSLAGIAATVKVIELPDLPPKGDVSDWLAAGGTVEQLAELVEAAPEWTPTATKRARGANSKLRVTLTADERPTITITTDEPKVVDEAIAALESDSTVYKRGNVLTTIIRDEKPSKLIIRQAGAPRIVQLAIPTLREKMSGSAQWKSLRKLPDDGGFEETPAHPPEWAVKAVAARGHYPAIRPIEGVVETPILRPDGTILDRPGYDAATGLLYEPRISFPHIIARPTLDHAVLARDTILEVVADFPFAQPSHKSGWLAGLLTLFARSAFHGPAPMFPFDANTRGSGKSLLADSIGMIFRGGPMARMINAQSDDEMRKRITTIAIEGELAALLDNIGNTLGCPSLDAVLTGTVWKDRVLGVNKSTGELPITTTWFATGNNIAYNGDTIRRVCPIRLETDLEKPEERSGFEHPDLLAWVQQERPRLVAAVLTVLRGYYAAGRPDQGLKPWGSYEAWSAIVRNVIVWVGMDDPAVARIELAEQADREAGTLRALIAGWQEIAGDPGMTVAEVFRILDDNFVASQRDLGRAGRERLEHEGLRAAIAEVCGKPLGKLPSPISLGMKLHHLRGRVVDGRRFVARDEHGTKVWRVETLGGGT